MISFLFRQTAKPCAQKVEIGCVSDHVVTSFLGGDLLVNKSQGHRGTKGILLFFQKPERYNQEVLSLFHLFTITIYGRNCFDMQH